MNGHAFQCHEEHTDPKQFAKTLKILGKYIAMNMKKCPGDMAALTHHLKPPTIATPTLAIDGTLGGTAKPQLNF